MERFLSYRFCSNRKCSRSGECLRNIINAEFNTIIKRCDFECGEQNGYPYLLLSKPLENEIDADFQTIIKESTNITKRKKRSDAGKKRA